MADKGLFRETLAANLRDDGHLVVTCSARGLARLRSAFRVVVVVAPCRGDAVGAVRKLRERQGEVPLILVTVDPAGHGRRLMRAQSVLTAPISYDALHRVIDQIAA